MKDQERLFSKLLEEAKTNKKGLLYLKSAAVRCQCFELASNLRSLETSLFPETKEQKDAKANAKKIALVFRMVDLNVSDENCFVIAEAMKHYTKMKGKFSIKEASQILAKKNEFFIND